MRAPIVLFVYNRPGHTRATIEALANNTLAPDSDLIIFSDAARDASGAAAVTEVREIISRVTGFASVRVVLRETNLGLAGSVIAGVTAVIEDFGTAIVLEDDLLTSRHFLEYMNRALEHYQDDPKAFSIGAYQFPERTMPLPRGYPWDTYASYRCCSWGWATWKDRWALVDWDMRYFDSFRADAAAQTRFNRGGPDMAGMLEHQHLGRIDSWAIRFCYAHFADDGHCIYPVKSLANNIGLDRSGAHCGPDPRRQHERLDDTWLPRTFAPADPVDPGIADSFFKAFCAGEEETANRGALNKAKGLLRPFVRRARAIAGAVRREVFRPIQSVDILVVNTDQKRGGAARAAFRAFLGIKQDYPAAHYLTLLKEDRRADISGRYHHRTGMLVQQLSRLDRIPLRRYPNRKNTTFTPGVWANPLRVPLSRFDAKIVHLNWVAAGMLRVEELARLGVPVVWTLLDTWAFTGGCHYPGECDGFKKQCGACPQLGSSNANDLSHALWRRKQKVYANLNLTVVGPSRWLADTARQSSLFSGHRIEVIPSGLDTTVFRPIERGAAKAYFGAAAHHPVLAFGAEWLTDPRKGGDLLRNAIGLIDFPCTLLTFGEGTLPTMSSRFVNVRALGRLTDDIALALMYSAADVFVCPSREDNLPNTVAEALACGTPCAAFDVNGLPDMIEHRKTGWLATAFDAADLAAGITWLATHPDPQQLRHAARAKAEAEYSLPVMAKRYATLYAELLSTNARGGGIA